MKMINALNVTLLLVGIVVIFLGLNIGLGGIRTLGWQNASQFIIVSDLTIFQAQDNHIRFIGGVWFGVGLLFFIGGIWLDRLRTTLISMCGIIALAGLFRLSALDGSVILSAGILPSMLAEVVGFPLLGWWLVRRGTNHNINDV